MTDKELIRELLDLNPEKCCFEVFFKDSQDKLHILDEIAFDDIEEFFDSHRVHMG